MGAGAGGEVPQEWSVVSGGGVEEGSEQIIDWVRPEDGKKSKSMAKYLSTQAQHHQQYQHQTTKTPN